MPTPTDRNLLYGILALQMDFVRKDELIASMNAWLLAKQRPLGDLLVESGALRADNRVLLDALVKAHLAQHSGDAQQSLRALSSLGPDGDELRRIADPEVRASLGHVGRSRAVPADPDATVQPVAGSLTSGGQRFRVLRPHAEGGLGRVSVALDGELRREVALKEIKGERADDPESRARFVLEAEVTGGLEHPGIVPVYGLGTYADGRPFYAMRFVRGDSLKEAVERFHSKRRPLARSSYEGVEFRSLLGRFVDVCQAVAYAHSRGVLHRDLKPGNVMLGKYGETLLVDWGLAKPLCTDPAARGPTLSEEAPLQPSSASGTGETLPGTAVGTPEYMSPEQAAGRWDVVGQPSDVYGLGAMLYAILTGRPPVTAANVPDRLRKVMAGEIAPPRSAQPALPQALAAVCMKSLALEPARRYPSALALAADIERWLADDAVAAWREPWTKRLSRWGRRHRTVVTAASVLLVTAVIALATGVVLLERKQAEIVQERNAAQRARDQAETTAKFYEDYVLAAPRPKGWEGGFGKDMTLRETLDVAAPKIGAAFAGQPEMEAKVRNTLGATYWYLGQFDAAYPHLEKAYAIRLERLGEDHPDTLTSLDSLAMQCWKQDKYAEAVAMGRRSLEKRRRVLGPEHQDTLWTQINLGLFIAQAEGRWAADPEQLDEAETLLRQALEAGKRTLGPDHHHTLYGQMCLYLTLRYKGKTEESTALNRQTLEARRRALGPDHPDTLRSMNDLAWVLEGSNHLDEAEALCQQALAARRRVLGDAHTETFWSLGCSAVLLADRGEVAKAEDLRRQTANDCQRLRGPDDPEAIACLTHLGNFLARQGKLDEASKTLRLVVERSRRSLGPEHGETLFRQNNLASSLRRQGQTAEAEALYRDTLAAQRRVRGPDHPNTLYTQTQLAQLLTQTGNVSEAESLYRGALVSTQGRLRCVDCRVCAIPSGS